MKRGECTAEALKALGYKAMVTHTGFMGRRKTTECHERHACELFEAVANAVRNGEVVEIRRNPLRYTVKVFIESARHSYRGGETVYFLCRSMTEAERLEANLE